MKALRLFCTQCSAVKLFHADTLEGILTAIDESGWHDKPTPKSRPKGEAIGLCPDCVFSAEVKTVWA